MGTDYGDDVSEVGSDHNEVGLDADDLIATVLEVPRMPEPERRKAARLSLEVWANGVKTRGLIDTGASVTVMSLKLAQKCV